MDAEPLGLQKFTNLVVFEMAPPSAFDAVEVLGFGAADDTILMAGATKKERNKQEKKQE